MKVGARLKEMRRVAGFRSNEAWGQAAAEVAQELGIDPIGGPQWGKLIRGEQIINCAHLEVAAAVLRVPVAELVSDAAPASSGPAGLSAEALAVARILDTEGPKAAISYLLGGLR